MPPNAKHCVGIYTKLLSNVNRNSSTQIEAALEKGQPACGPLLDEAPKAGDSLMRKRQCIARRGYALQRGYKEEGGAPLLRVTALGTLSRVGAIGALHVA